MTIETISLPAIAVLGIEGTGEAGTGAKWIAPLWTQANARFGEVEALAQRNDDGSLTALWGAMRNMDGSDTPWGPYGRYLAGVQADAHAEPPPGWALWTIPEHTYLMVACTRETYGGVMASMHSRVLPDRGCRLHGAIQERYDPADASGGMFLLFPIA